MSTITSIKKLDKKIKIGWFSFSCCEDNTIVMTELLNDHWQEWKNLFEFTHVKVLKSKNVWDKFDIAFVEGAITSDEQITKLKKIRSLTNKLVAIGSCAVQGLPAGQRNIFNEEQKNNIAFLLKKFAALPKVLKVSEVVTVDAQVSGCPMDPNSFLKTVNNLVKELQTSQ